MQRRTITVPDDLDAEISALVASRVVTNASRFFQDAARAHLVALREARMAAEAALLDPDEEVATARATRRPRRHSPWGRLR